ncbi:MAG TPA: hypothetical protein DCS93_42395 [Microscillaceae bacterium]|nr:hypothetical protein [Microscillaceae bacterium]
MKKIAIATCARIPELIPAEQSIVKELAQKGFDTQPVVWTDTSINWQQYDLVIIRSVWDYFKKYEAFIKWLDQLQNLGIKVCNTIEVMKANSHKFYLEHLAAQGIAIVPTVFVRQNSVVSITEMLSQQNWQQGIIKPAISASAYKTYKLAQTEASDYQSKLEDLVQETDVLVQAFLPQIQTEGEWSLMFFGGKYSHSVRKVPKNQEFRVQSEFGGQALAETPPPFVIHQAQNIVDIHGEELLYARVDGVVVEGNFLLMELELIEPELFLDRDSEATTRFVTAIINAL